MQLKPCLGSGDDMIDTFFITMLRPEQEVYCSQYCGTGSRAFSNVNVEMPKQPIKLPESKFGHSSANPYTIPLIISCSRTFSLTQKNLTRFACRQAV